VFERFVQLQQEGANVHHGVGLGLPISRSLARLMGGDLTLRSEAGQGCIFELTCAAPVVAGQPATPPRLSASSQPCQWQGRRILIVEDTAANEFLLRAFLEPTRAIVESATNGKQAVESCRQAADAASPYDVILMDMQLPVMDGFAATARLREDGCAAQIIASTAGAAVSDRERCLASGCNGFIAKPFNRDTVLDAIASAWNRRFVATAHPVRASNL
jgi:CheY-like chemotaxis protein